MYSENLFIRFISGQNKIAFSFRTPFKQIENTHQQVNPSPNIIYPSKSELKLDYEYPSSSDSSSSSDGNRLRQILVDVKRVTVIEIDAHVEGIIVNVTVSVIVSLILVRIENKGKGMHLQWQQRLKTTLINVFSIFSVIPNIDIYTPQKRLSSML
ncbi:hypothetical protein pb186bvf_013049 [Paramecium bursaria]